MKKKSGFAQFIPFDQYPKVKSEWEKQHPKAEILEEIKSISMGIMEFPDPIMIGQKTQQNVVMIGWGVVYEEEEQDIYTPFIESKNGEINVPKQLKTLSVLTENDIPVPSIDRNNSQDH